MAPFSDRQVRHRRNRQRRWCECGLLAIVCASMLLLSACRVVTLPSSQTTTAVTEPPRTSAIQPLTGWPSQQTTAPEETSSPDTTAWTAAIQPQLSVHDMAARIIPSFEKRYLLVHLDEDRLATFCTLYQAAMAFEPTAELSEPVTVGELFDLMLLLNYTCPELMQISGEYRYSYDDTGRCTDVTFTYLMNSDEYDDAVRQVEAQFDEWKHRLAGQSDLEKERFVYEWIIQTAVYQETATHAGSSYGVIVDRKARCEGYAKTFMWAMWELDIPCISITGESTDPGNSIYSRHVWNVVQVNGIWSYVDTTFDDFSEAYPISYSFLNVDENSIEATRTIDPVYLELNLPSCTSMENSFHEQAGVYYRGDANPMEVIADAIEHADAEGSNRVYLKVETAELFQSISDSLGDMLTQWLTERGLPWSYTWYSYSDGRAFVIDFSD